MMKPLLDTFPFAWSRPEAGELHLVLTTLYPNERAATFVADRAGLPTYRLALGQSAYYLWRDIIDQAAAGKLLRKLVTLAAEQNAASDAAAFFADLLADVRPAVAAEPRNSDGSPRFARGSSKITEPEALLFRDDLTMSIDGAHRLGDTLAILLEKARAVCHLTVTSDNGTTSYGTGFHIGDGRVLTNHHVLHPTQGRAIKVVAAFGYETGPGGTELPAAPFACDLATVIGDAEDDWSVVTATGIAATAPVLDPRENAPPVVADAAYVIQHPLGGRKRIGFIRNTITDVDEYVVHYLTDTQPGSSGSPVFDAAGKLVALHHAGGVPEDVTGRQPLIKNEGILMSRVAEALAARGVLPIATT